MTTDDPEAAELGPTRKLIPLPFAVRRLEVRRVVDVTPAMVRVTLTGDQLDASVSPDGQPQPAFHSPAFDDSCRLFFPHPGQTETVLPRSRAVREGQSPLARAYTVRRHDPDAREIDLDVVLHQSGTATTWARHAQPGDQIYVGGPKASWSTPANADWLLLAADETGIPALARLLDEAHPGLRARILIEVQDDAHRVPLRPLPDVDITWVPRGTAAPGTTTLLTDAVRDTTFPQGTPFAWVAAEETAVRNLREHLRRDRQLPVTAIDATKYWRRNDRHPS